MSTTEQTTKTEQSQPTHAPEQVSAVNMESVHRIAKLPVVESTINAATNLYEKAKDSNAMINWTLSTAESTVNTAVEKITPLAQPVTSRLEGPIKKVDEMLCTGLDYVENKVPCVKLPPSEMLENTKHYINETITPAMQTARIVAQPAMQGAVALKDMGVQKVEEFIGRKQDSASSDGRPKRLRPALLPSSFVSLVYMHVNLEQMMPDPEYDNDTDIQDEATNDTDQQCSKVAKN